MREASTLVPWPSAERAHAEMSAAILRFSHGCCNQICARDFSQPSLSWFPAYLCQNVHSVIAFMTINNIKKPVQPGSCLAGASIRRGNGCGTTYKASTYTADKAVGLHTAVHTKMHVLSDVQPPVLLIASPQLVLQGSILYLQSRAGQVLSYSMNILSWQTEKHEDKFD